MKAEERQALNAFVAAVRRHYGSRLHDIVLFGSQARGDARPDSDADVAVILEDGDWRFWREKMALAALAYDALIEAGLFIQPWPIARGGWETPSKHHNRRFVEAVKRDVRRLPEAA
jgi:predicted nucleotidyltransferase